MMKIDELEFICDFAITMLAYKAYETSIRLPFGYYNYELLEYKNNIDKFFNFLEKAQNQDNHRQSLKT